MVSKNKQCEEVARPMRDRRPELVELTERLTNAVNHFECLTFDLDSKLQIIKRYSEPEVEDERSINESESFADEVLRLIEKLERCNSKIEFSLRHLNELV
jgi:hypothetical protein